MRATIISMVMGLPGSLPGMSVAGGLRLVRERGVVKPGLGPGLCQVQVRTAPGWAWAGVQAARSLQTLPSVPLVILDSST